MSCCDDFFLKTLLCMTAKAIFAVHITEFVTQSRVRNNTIETDIAQMAMPLWHRVESK